MLSLPNPIQEQYVSVAARKQMGRQEDTRARADQPSDEYSPEGEEFDSVFQPLLLETGSTNNDPDVAEQHDSEMPSHHEFDGDEWTADTAQFVAQRNPDGLPSASTALIPDGNSPATGEMVNIPVVASMGNAGTPNRMGVKDTSAELAGTTVATIAEVPAVSGDDHPATQLLDPESPNADASLQSLEAAVVEVAAEHRDWVDATTNEVEPATDALSDALAEGSSGGAADAGAETPFTENHQPVDDVRQSYQSDNSPTSVIPVTGEPAAEAQIPVAARASITSQLTRAITEFTRTESADGESTLKLRLDPPDLGELVIRMDKSDDKLSLRVEAIEQSTLDMLLARGTEIIDQLRRQETFSDLEFSAALLSDSLGGETEQDQHSQQKQQDRATLHQRELSEMINRAVNGLSFRA